MEPTQPVHRRGLEGGGRGLQAGRAESGTIAVVRRPTASFAHRLIAALAFQLLAAIAATAASAPPASSERLREGDLQQIGPVVQSEIEAGRIHGAVIEIGQGDQIVYRHAFGYRELEPQRVAMTPDTIFDLASLTKPV